MNNLRKIAAGSLAAVLAFSMAACGSSNASSDGTGESTGKAVTVNEKSAKATSLADFGTMEDLEKAAKEEGDRMLARVKSMQKRSDYLKAMLLNALHATGKVKTARVTVSIRTTQAVAVDEGANLPEAYTTVKTTVSPNKVAIKQALLDGVEVPGCSLEARESVSIR